MREYWLFAAGGTGRRVALAMLHMCAAGALAGDRLHIRYADTDDEESEECDWFVTLKQQFELYKNLHEIFKDDGKLFSCEINYPIDYETPEYITPEGVEVPKEIHKDEARQDWIGEIIGISSKEKESTIQSVYNGLHSFEERLLIQALLGKENTTNIKPFWGLCAAPNVGALLLKSRIQDNDALKNFFGLDPESLMRNAEARLKNARGKKEEEKAKYELERAKAYKEKKYKNEYEYNKDHPIAFAASSFGGTGAAFVPAVRQHLNVIEKTPSRCAMLFLDQHFKISPRWTEDIFDEKRPAMKKFLEDHHAGEFYILDTKVEDIKTRGKDEDKGQKNWPSKTECLATILLCAFFTEGNFGWKTANPETENNGDFPNLRDRYEAFNKLALSWCADFEGSQMKCEKTGKVKWHPGAAWTGRIPKRKDEFLLFRRIKTKADSEYATLEDETLKNFLIGWLRWRQQIDGEYAEDGGSLTIEPTSKDEIAAAVECWYTANTKLNHTKAQLFNELFEVCMALQEKGEK